MAVASTPIIPPMADNIKQADKFCSVMIRNINIMLSWMMDDDGASVDQLQSCKLVASRQSRLTLFGDSFSICAPVSLLLFTSK
jgi:hypothetical protein